MPLDLTIMNGAAYITDSGSGIIRMLDLRNGLVTNMTIFNYSKLCFGYTPIIQDFRNGDTLFVTNSKNTISLKFNLTEEYEIDKEGFSQASTSSRSEALNVTDNLMNDMTIELEYDSDSFTTDLVVDYVLFFKSKTQPELQYKRTVSYLFPIVHSTKVKTQYQELEITFNPDSEE